MNEWKSEYIVTEWVRDRCGIQKEHGKRAEADWKSFGADRKQKDLASTCALRPHAHSVLFQKADQTEKETGGTEGDIQTGDTGGNI